MKDVSDTKNQIQYVSNFQDLVSTPFQGDINAICWTRSLSGDFAEIVRKLVPKENMCELELEDLLALALSDEGKLARDILIQDMKLLETHGASPILNIIKCYEREGGETFFSTDVYSFHVDRSPVPADTFLCTYYGATSDILANADAEQKVFVPEIREGLKKIFDGSAEAFESFLVEHFFDLHYRAKTNAVPINLGVGQLWRLAVDHPESTVLPCIHRAPKEKDGELRLLLIC
jgi:hypothetical protein